MVLADRINHKDIEEKWQQIWSKKAVYNWEENLPREQTFVIDTPPPTVSGLLHMGHVFSYTQADFVARFQRMNGKTVFYPIGFDDNGLPTERLVEKVKKVRASSMSREDFIGLCHEVVDEAEQEFAKLFKSIALSFDWNQTYQTISSKTVTLSQMSFLDLIKKDRVYRQLQPCLWDPVDATALAQAEVVDIEFSSLMNDVVFELENGEQIIISTSRPELIPACVALFFHPEDKRYQYLEGKNAISPLFKVPVPIIADSTVEQEKGTGLVMCCTFGDTTDIEWWRKHNLPLRIILNKYGKIFHPKDFTSSTWPSLNSEKAKDYLSQIENLKAKDAREKILQLLKEHDCLKDQQPITHFVKCGERSKAPLEIIVSAQWFVKLLDIKDQLLEQSAKCNWHPAYMKTRLDQWIEGLKWDWCISRQRFFGVPFPVWYSKRPGEEGKILFADPENLPINPLVDLPKGYSKEEVEPDFDVMDTWATSSISPQLNSGAINAEFALDYERHKKLFPADMRPQAHEIIRVWTFYTIVKSYIHEQQIPWHNLMISGWCLASDKTKMSKSKGNVVTPVELIKEKGADIVRYWASNSKLGADIAYSEEIFKIASKLINKIWNASKFAQLQLNHLSITPQNLEYHLANKDIYKPIDLWILSKLQQTLSTATKEFKKFEYCNARVITEEFFWHYLCDNYIEIVKTRAYNEQKNDFKGQQSALLTIHYVFEIILKLFAPFLPHVTEEIFSNLYPDQGLIHQRGMWPDISLLVIDDKMVEQGDYFICVLQKIRQIKSDLQLSISAPIETLSIESKIFDFKILEDDLKNVSKAINITDKEIDNMISLENTAIKIGCKLK